MSNTYSKQVSFSYRNTTNHNTIAEWEACGIVVSEDKKTDPKTGVVSKTFSRPDIVLNAEIPTVEYLLNDAEGKKVLEKLVESAATSILGNYAKVNKLEEIPELTPSVIWAALQEPEKEESLRATKEEMQIAADVFAEYLKATGKTGNNADLQVEFFAAKYSQAKLSKFVANLYSAGADKERAIEILDKIKTNLVEFVEQVGEEDEEIQAACSVPCQICVNSVNKYIDSLLNGTEEEESILNVDDF